ncbi:MAG: DUF3465 domain-containing protein [Candidatus Sericytochromatia bacterium]
MKKISLFILTLFLISCSNQESLQILPEQNLEQNQTLAQTIIQAKKGNPQSIIEHGIYFGTVTEKLPDDNDGLKHELFKIKFTQGKYAGKIIKVAHDTTYAPYVPLEVNDNVEIKGDLIINAQPEMVLHWTHKSDNPKHPSGYIKVKGKTYE